MSITVADLLTLPSLRAARVAAGKDGLSNIVSAVSVLEAVEPQDLLEMAARESPYTGSELVITGFINAKDDVELQCANIKHLAGIGASALVLYYVGIDVKYIHPRLIALSDELHFPLIVMPENRHELRYSEVISEVMEAIIRERSNSTSLTSDVFEQLSKLAEHQRTVDTLLRILSDKLHITLAIQDSYGRTLNLASWPSTDSTALNRIAAQTENPGKAASSDTASREYHYIKTIDVKAGGSLKLIIIKQETEILEQLADQICEVVKLFIEIYSNHHGEVVISELIRAIMHDEQIKIRRLADYFNLDVSIIDTLWVLSANTVETAFDVFAPSIPSIRELLRPLTEVQIVDIYESYLVILFKRPFHYSIYRELAEAVLELYPEGSIYMSQHTSCTDANAIRNGFIEHKSLIRDMKKVFPTWRIFQDSEFFFIRQCRQYVDAGAESVARHMRLLEPILNYPKCDDLLETLTVYLLDATGSIQETSEIMFVHRSTVKYRMSSISNILGYRPDMMPSSLPLHYAVAVRRMLS